VNDDELSTVVVPVRGALWTIALAVTVRVKVQVPCRICVGVGPAEGVTADLQVATGGHRSAVETLRLVVLPVVATKVTPPPLLPDVVNWPVYADDPSTVVVSVVSPIWLIVLGVTVSVKVQVPASPNPSDVVPETV